MTQPKRCGAGIETGSGRSATAGSWIAQLFEGWLVRKPSLQVRRQCHPKREHGDLAEGLPTRRASRPGSRRTGQVYLFQTPSRSENGLWAYSAYASDSWQLTNRLTINPGLRFDRYRVFLPEQQHLDEPFAGVSNVIDWNVIAPRIGAAYKLDGNGRTLVKASYGQYWITPGDAVGANVNPNANEWWRLYQWSDLDGSGAWSPGEELGRHSQTRRSRERITRSEPEVVLRERNHRLGRTRTPGERWPTNGRRLARRTAAVHASGQEPAVRGFHRNKIPA